jgi:hypothetical protein
MSKKEFEEFLSKKKQELPDAAYWNSQKKEWLSYLSELYKTFEDALKDFTVKGEVSISYDEITITEDFIGSYNVRRMTIDILGHKIVLTPLGTNLIAAKGRVDMTDRRGKSNTVRIALVDSLKRGLLDHIQVRILPEGEIPKETERPEREPIIWQWKFVTPPPEGLYIPVNKDTIYTTIMDMVNA